jgi:uncharacterized protein YdeI (BOF family)
VGESRSLPPKYLSGVRGAFSFENRTLIAFSFFGRTDKISDILSSPSKYRDKTVKVEGKVIESLIAFEIGYFILSDDTGSITVIPSKTFPKKGETVTIKGKVNTAFVIDDKSLTVIVEEGEKDEK